ncbi:MAG: phenylalanine--tRNA ligase subunit alpha [Candidatus Omnitrophica bacterium]|nr:phenylalanine--tRNA ligase subunit alpha [Candidatus Omnitrophota bacterium]
MQEKFNVIKQEAQEAIRKVSSLAELEEARVRFLGRKSKLASLSATFSGLEPSQRPEAGRLFNEVKVFIAGILEEKKKTFSFSKERIDITFPSKKTDTATKHPLSSVVRTMCHIFEAIGFEIQEGAEIEDEWYNFQALNIPLEHPSRDAFDTFYLDLPAQGKYKYLLRSHTSPSQIRLMKKRKPPLAFVVPGRVYRPDNVDASHSFMFHQVEGFAVDRDITFAHLKGTLLYFAKHMFLDEAKLRFRPHFFPFTEPSAEVDISCIICRGKGCSVCKRTGWLEILGCGMIHPNVLKACGIDSKKYQGFAFGMGVERIAMLKYGINDIRLFFENDLRFLRQFYEV